KVCQVDNQHRFHFVNEDAEAASGASSLGFPSISHLQAHTLDHRLKPLVPSPLHLPSLLPV
ncbi:mCG13775, isoform CRA_d, partial [Mus musculus]